VPPFRFDIHQTMSNWNAPQQFQRWYWPPIPIESAKSRIGNFTRNKHTLRPY
jgi:hypothetical protein